MPDATSYDEVPYACHPVTYSHPDILATIGRIFGLDPPAVETSRVLELGCGDGTNLIPIACGLPESKCVGIDLSERQINDGLAFLADLPVPNVSLSATSILDIDDSYGQFDYIICHGVYSWVPPVVQEKILQICSRNLSPHGLAYISYNTYPGWHQRRMIREMMQFHVNRFTAARERIAEARKFLDFVIEVNQTQGQTTVYLAQLQEEALTLRDSTDSYLLHELLEEVNEPIYFHQFVERAAQHGLQYVSEARLSDSASRLSPQAKQLVAQWAENWVEIEQYMDFLRNGTFRRSILCHSSLNVERAPTLTSLAGFYLAARSRPSSPKESLASTAIATFETPDGATVSTNNPLVKTALWLLHDAFPRSLPFAEVFAEVQDRLTNDPDLPGDIDLHDEAVFSRTMMQCCFAHLAELHVHSPEMVTSASARPRSTDLIREQSRRTHIVSNLRHMSVKLSDWDRAVLGLLDGSRDHGQLLAELRTICVENQQPLEEASIGAALDDALLRFGKTALLVG